jgi:hypothetical protein
MRSYTVFQFTQRAIEKSIHVPRLARVPQVADACLRQLDAGFSLRRLGFNPG